MTPKEGHPNTIFGKHLEEVEHYTIFHVQYNHEYSLFFLTVWH